MVKRKEMSSLPSFPSFLSFLSFPSFSLFLSVSPPPFLSTSLAHLLARSLSLPWVEVFDVQNMSKQTLRTKLHFVLCVYVDTRCKDT